MMCGECKPNHYIDTQRCVACNAKETKATGNINTSFKIGVNLVLFLSPFWLLIQLRGLFLGIGGVVAIIGGVGELPNNWLTSLLKLTLSSFSFLNLDIAATRPGCGTTVAPFDSFKTPFLVKLEFSARWQPLSLFFGPTCTCYLSTQFHR